MRYRRMQLDDVREAAEIIAKHPVIGPRYGSVIANLPSAWLRLLDSEAVGAFVFHAEEGPDAPICFVGVSAIVNDDFARDLRTPPHFWIGPQLTNRILRDKSPLLSESQIREANSSGGLNLVVWEGCALPEFEGNSELHRFVVETFIHLHRGYLWKEVISSQVESVERLHFTLKTGGLLWDAAADRYIDSLIGDADEFIRKPHVAGIRRKELLEQPGRTSGASWVGCLFDYHPPRLGFNRSEQRLLTAAMTGATDEQLSNRLGTSVPAIKKTWASIYRRVGDRLPELVRDALLSDAGGTSRGREKKRELLAYLRHHPEELRPASRKRLSVAAPERA